MAKQKRNKQQLQALNPPVKMLVDDGSILQDQVKVIGAIYATDTGKEVVRRINAYDKLINALKNIEDISTFPNDGLSDYEALKEVNRLVKKTLQEI